MFIFPDAANDYSDNMSEQVDMVEVKTEPNDSDELFSICENINMVNNHSNPDKTTFQGNNHILINFKLNSQ